MYSNIRIDIELQSIPLHSKVTSSSYHHTFGCLSHPWISFKIHYILYHIQSKQSNRAYAGEPRGVESSKCWNFSIALSRKLLPRINLKPKKQEFYRKHFKHRDVDSILHESPLMDQMILSQISICFKVRKYIYKNITH